MRELNQLNNNSETIANKSQNRSRNQTAISNSEDFPFESESIQNVTTAPLTSSVTKNVSIPPSLDIEKLKVPGEIEKLVPNNRNIQRNVRQLLAQSMPTVAKKRKLQEMLDNNPIDNDENAGQRSSSNSQSQTVIERPPTISGTDYAQELLRNYGSGRVNRTYRSNSSISSNDSQVSGSAADSVVPDVIRDLSSQNIVNPSQEITLPPPSPAIRNRTQPSQPQRSQTVLYEPDSSSESNRSSDSESRRRGSKRAASRNPSVASEDEQAARRSRDEQAARRSADGQGIRRPNDGNDHSNLAAPRRINVDPPSATRAQPSKVMNGG